MSSSSSENGQPGYQTVDILTAEDVLGWAHCAVGQLSARRAEINALNVFPVPDSDTGSNMAHTMESALTEARKLPSESSVAKITEALAVGSVRGARGNSGVVLSQVLRAVAQAAADDVIDGASISNALSIARSLVDRAITDPVEGTVVTVLRSAAIAAEQSIDSANGSLPFVLNQAVNAARIALARTPSQLEVLREAGVVDAGGQGLVILLESLLEQVECSGARSEQEIQLVDFSMEDSASHGLPGELEVMFYIHCDSTKELDNLQQDLASLGDSLLIARETDLSGTVHIHSQHAGEVIEKAFSCGKVTDLRLEILPATGTKTPMHSTEEPMRILLAITPAGSLATLYATAGALVVSRDPAELLSADRSDEIVSEIVSQARRNRADEVILLPNGLLSKQELISIERSSHAFEQAITILPTSTLVAGIAALSVHDPGQPLGVDSYAMSEAASAMRTAVLRVAPNAALTQAGACSKGDLLAFVGQEILLVAEELNDALARISLRLLEGGGEQVTFLIDESIRDEFDEILYRRGLGSHTRVDITVYPASGMENLVEIGVE